MARSNAATATVLAALCFTIFLVSASFHFSLASSVNSYNSPFADQKRIQWRQSPKNRNGRESSKYRDEDFFGQSPPVYPSPEMTGLGPWKDAYVKAKDFVSRLTLEEKAQITTGQTSNTSGCVGSIKPIDRVSFPGLCLEDAGNGVRNTDLVYAYPSGIHVGASWNKALTRARGEAMGLEFRIKGINVLLGPSVGPLGRVVRGGRNWEGFSIDPYLSGVLVSETVKGIQYHGVMASTKHYIANEQETNRRLIGDVEAVSSNMDDKTMHELYLWPFQDAVKAGTVNIMCSYQRLNNSYACSNSKTLNGLLKTELGFQGYVVSDWNAIYSGIASSLAGLDMVMPSSPLWGDELVKGVKNGTLPEARLDDMVTRIIASWYRLDQDKKDFPEPGVGKARNLLEPHPAVDARREEALQILTDGAAEGHVLVKNTKNTLPLRRPRMISLFGYSAKAPDRVNPGQRAPGFSYPDVVTGESHDIWGNLISQEVVDAGHLPEESSLHDKFRKQSKATQEEKKEGEGIISPIGLHGTVITGGGAGATSPSNLISPFEAIKWRAYVDKTAVFWDLTSTRPHVDTLSDVCIVFGNAWSEEKYDRPTLMDEYTDNLVLDVASKCAKTVVVLHNAGVRLVERFADHPNVTAIIYAHLPGEASGPALTSLLYGDINFSGRLPYTVAKQASDYSSADPDLPDEDHTYFPQSNFTEGVFVDYRHFDKYDIEPRYAFGFGLSYSQFMYGGIEVRQLANETLDAYPSGPLQEGGLADLWDELVEVNVTLENISEVDGFEVAQLYLAIPGDGNDTPAKQLRGFEKRWMDAKSQEVIVFRLTRRDLSVWDTTAQQWKLRDGKYRVWVGSNSRDTPLKLSFTLPL